jgi:hypothetical protein
MNGGAILAAAIGAALLLGLSYALIEAVAG